ncbi:MAG: hypothetical protein AB7R89_23080 [Dehalococcoidia bacterium]
MPSPRSGRHQAAITRTYTPDPARMTAALMKVLSYQPGNGEAAGDEPAASVKDGERDGRTQFSEPR